MDTGTGFDVARDERDDGLLPRLLPAVGVLLVGVLLAILLNGCATAAAEEKAVSKADFHYQLANNFFYDRNTLDAMKECYAALAIDPNHADAHHLLGFIFFGRKQYPEAIEAFQKAIAGRERFYEAIANLGAVYLAQKRWGDAVAQFEKLTREQLYPTPSLAHVNLGWAFFNLKRHGEALEHYKLALFLNPNLCLGYNNLGLLYEAMGEATLAIESLQMATDKCPKYAEPLFHLGRLLSQKGQVAEATRAFERCRELEPDTQLGRRCATRRL
jgi:tetratricopeptide (TPR) repeat protein